MYTLENTFKDCGDFFFGGAGERRPHLTKYAVLKSPTYQRQENAKNSQLDGN